MTFFRKPRLSHPSAAVCFSFAKGALAALLFAALLCLSQGTAAFGQSGLWAVCRGQDPAARITACTAILARGNKETRSKEIAAFINRSSAYRALGDLDRAQADIDAALRRNPKSALALSHRAAISFEKKDIEQAIADYTAAITAQPKSSALYRGRGDAYLAANDLDRAIADFSQALRLNKNQTEAYAGRARAYRAKGDFEKAVSGFDEAIKRDPRTALLYAERGAVRQAMGDLDQAIADHTKALERDPKFAEAHNNRGLAFLAKGETGQALADFSAAIEQDPAYAAALLNRANAYRVKGDLEGARLDLLAALRRDPNLAEAKEALDEVERRLALNAPPQSPPAHGHANLPWPLALPFAGMLLSIALGPLVVTEWWHIHYEKAAAFWAVLTLIGLAMAVGPVAAMEGLVHNMALDYLPFILMLLALFTAAGGILVEGELIGSPLVNTAILAFGTILASFIGTTGASMILIRPLIRANHPRPVNVHVIVFFIFLVSNIGGALTPLGDPPLFLGFLQGVNFFWTLRALWPHTLFTAGVLLAIFFCLDFYFYRREKRHAAVMADRGVILQISGLVNIPLIAIVILAIVASGFWRPGMSFDVLGTRIELQNLIRDLIMILVALASLRLTRKHVRAANGFEWEPIREVAYLFAGIFISIIPVMAMLKAGMDGPFSAVIQGLSHPDGTPNNAVYFWATGLLSSFLDNAPTYLVFFELASGDPIALMGPLAGTLTAISLGAVFMGGMTYIGNAPNFMVYAIARRAGISMPAFFPYMIWSSAILLPVFAAVTWLFLLRIPG